MHIAIEGMDGVGKTTAARNLAERLNFTLVEKPLHYLFDEEDGSFNNYIRIRDYINEQVDDNALRAWFYGLGNIFLYNKFDEVNVITDRHFASNYFWCGNEKTEAIFDLMINLIGKPDFTFLIYTTVEEAEKRIRSRDPSDPDLHKAKLYPHAKKKMENFLKKYKMDFVAIDTTNLNPKEVVEKMLSSLTDDLKNKIGCK